MANISDTLDIAILNAGTKRPAIVYARCDSDLAVASLPSGQELKALLAFRDRINSSLLLNQPRPKKSELAQFGLDLFDYIVRDSVRTLYNRLPINSLIRIHILTNRPDLQSLPWEYLQYPQQQPGPWRDRSIVRIVPTIGRPRMSPLPLKKAGQKIKILFVYADPVNQGLVGWPNVKASVEQVFSARIPSEHYELKVIEGTLPELISAFQDNNEQYEIFQFSGHGDIDPQTGEGQILLLDKTNKSYPLRASNLSLLLSGRGIRLAVLSACLTSAGNAADPFNVVAEALVSNGIPAVVANQLPVPDASVAVFVGPLYTQLLNTGDIDIAVNEGRVKLALELELPQDATLEWGIPTLYRHITSSKVFEPLVPQSLGLQQI